MIFNVWRKKVECLISRGGKELPIIRKCPLYDYYSDSITNTNKEKITEQVIIACKEFPKYLKEMNKECPRYMEQHECKEQ